MAKVVLSEPAKDDLLDIEYYISIELCNPQSAKKIANGILNVIRSLEVYPRRHSYVIRILYGQSDWENILKE